MILRDFHSHELESGAIVVAEGKLFAIEFQFGRLLIVGGSVVDDAMNPMDRIVSEVHRVDLLTFGEGDVADEIEIG